MKARGARRTPRRRGRVSDAPRARLHHEVLASLTRELRETDRERYRVAPRVGAKGQNPPIIPLVAPPGIEPGRHLCPWILNPLRLPFRHRALINYFADLEPSLTRSLLLLATLLASCPRWRRPRFGDGFDERS